MSTLITQDWLTRPATQAVMQALEAQGGEGCARFVGGAVRDAVMGRPVSDIDIATVLLPEVVVAALQAAGLKAIPTGLAHGTITAVSEHRPYEITTLRQDVSTDGRRATVAYTDDWSADARRRDFRLNALYADAAGQVFDPTGEGVADARGGRIVFVGDPVTRIREDYLRILRFFRFFAWFGQGQPDGPGLAACAAEVAGMACLSAERVQSELLKLLSAPDPVPAVMAMQGAGVLQQILPGAVAGPGFVEGARFSADPVVRLMLLLPAQADGVAQMTAGLRLANAVRDRLVRAAAVAPDLAKTLDDDAALRRLLYRHGQRAVADALVRQWAETPQQRGAVERLMALARDWPIPPLPVSGRDVARLGLAPGPLVGQVLSQFETDWMAEDFPTGGHAERLRALVAALGSAPG